jgi:lipoyl-dependent peroxiredoxin
VLYGMTISDTSSVKTPEKIVYTARATSSGGRRQGHVKTDDGKLDLQLTAPKETGGPGTGVNPELLFASGYSACFQSALGLAAKAQGVDTSDSLVTAEVGFGPEGESFGITVDLKVAVPGLELATVQELADTAHQLCPYSKATRGNIPVTVTAVEAA